MALFVPETVFVDLLQKGQIPLEIESFDNRVCCRYARRGQSPVDCPELRRNSDRATWCGLNGAERNSLCVFDEPENSEVWERIREQQEFESGADR